jgi:putative mycofactocin binding protein MftB
VTAFDLERPWRVGSQVALRPERFGALAYHFGTRRLSFLKSRKLLDVATALGDHPTGRDACRAVGVTDAEMPAYAQALGTLANTGMIEEREVA